MKIILPIVVTLLFAACNKFNSPKVIVENKIAMLYPVRRYLVTINRLDSDRRETFYVDSNTYTIIRVGKIYSRDYFLTPN